MHRVIIHLNTERVRTPRAGAAYLAELPFCPEVPVDTSASGDTAQIGPFRVEKAADFLPHHCHFILGLTTSSPKRKQNPKLTTFVFLVKRVFANTGLSWFLSQTA